MEKFAISSDLIRGHIDTIILYSLASGDKYAQQISDSIEENSNNEYKINQATLYSSLTRLENLKYVTSYRYDTDDGGRRKYFHLTDFGKDVIKDNIENWSRSRAIIDKLIGCKPENSKIVYLQQSVVVESAAPTQVDKPIQEELNPQSQIAISINAERKDDEFNFRKVLSSLVKDLPESQTKTAETSEKPGLEAESSLLNLSKETKVEDLQAVINENVSLAQRIDSDKIDFSDVISKVELDGFKVKISSKDSANPTGRLKINKLNFVSSAIAFTFAFVQFLLVYLLVLGQSTKILFITSSALCAIYPVYSLVRFLLNKKTIARKINADSILTASIIAFNVLLIVFSGAFLFDIDFTIKQQVVNYIVYPVLIVLNAMLFFVLRAVLCKSKKFFC